FETDGGVVVDVEAFANARYGYDIRCEAVGESGTLALAPHARLVGDIPAGYPQRFADAYRLELQAWVDGEANGAPAWDGYMASVVSRAAVTALERGESVEVEPKIKV